MERNYLWGSNSGSHTGSTNLPECLNMEPYHAIWKETYHGNGTYHGNRIIPRPWNHTTGTIPRPWNHTIGIIPWKWNHTMGPYHGHGIIPLESYQGHVIGIIPLGSYQGHGIIPLGSYQGHGIIPWDHTKAMESYQGHGIIPWNHTKSLGSHQDRIIPEIFLHHSYIKTSLFKITCRSKQTKNWHSI